MIAKPTKMEINELFQVLVLLCIRVSDEQWNRRTKERPLLFKPSRTTTLWNDNRCKFHHGASERCASTWSNYLASGFDCTAFLPAPPCGSESQSRYTVKMSSIHTNKQLWTLTQWRGSFVLAWMLGEESLLATAWGLLLVRGATLDAHHHPTVRRDALLSTRKCGCDKTGATVASILVFLAAATPAIASCISSPFSLWVLKCRW